MARHIDAWMDGVKLADIGAILIQGVEESPAEMETTYGTRPIRGGRDVLVLKRNSLKVTIKCAIKELWDLKRRTEILQQMAAWASGSILELSNHPGQRLRVRCKAFPSLGDVRNYTEEMNIELEADNVPYWEDSVPTQTIVSNTTTGTATLLIPGTTLTPIDFRIVPMPSGYSNGTLAVTMSNGATSKTISLSGVIVGPYSALDLKVDDFDRFAIFSGQSNRLSCRSIDSADDFFMPPGVTTISWDSSVEGRVTISARGRWL